MKTAICTINYTSKQDTIDLLNNLNNLEGDFEVFLIENGSPKNKISKFDLPKTKYKKHFYISKTNLGFAGGNNLLIKKALKLGNFEYFWLLNNDTKPKPDALAQLLETFKNKSDTGIVGSLILQGDTNKVWWAGSSLDLAKGKIVKKYFNEDSKSVPKDTIQTDEVNGASMFIKKQVVEKIGYLDTVFFHTAEDTDYSIRAKKAGFELYVNPKSVVLHGVGKSSGGAYSPMHMYYVERGRVMLLKKWGYLKIKSIPFLLLLWSKRIAAPLIKKHDLKSSLYTIKGIVEGLFKKV